MLLFYYDEVKYDPPSQKYFWLGGIGAKSDSISTIEALVSDVAESCFGSRALSKDFEFHGKELVQGKGVFKGCSIEDRLAALIPLLEVVSREDVYRFYVKLKPENILTACSHDERAFMFLVEKINDFAARWDEFAMIFGDYDEPVIGPSVISLSRYREGGTDWKFGRNIDRIIDTVHFAKSHHSRLIQLSDVYIYMMQFLEQENESDWRKRIVKAVTGNRNINLFPTFYKEWPNQKDWYR